MPRIESFRSYIQHTEKHVYRTAIIGRTSTVVLYSNQVINLKHLRACSHSVANLAAAKSKQTSVTHIPKSSNSGHVSMDFLSFKSLANSSFATSGGNRYMNRIALNTTCLCLLAKSSISHLLIDSLLTFFELEVCSLRDV